MRRVGTGKNDWDEVNRMQQEVDSKGTVMYIEMSNFNVIFKEKDEGDREMVTTDKCQFYNYIYIYCQSGSHRPDQEISTIKQKKQS